MTTAIKPRLSDQQVKAIICQLSDEELLEFHAIAIHRVPPDRRARMTNVDLWSNARDAAWLSRKIAEAWDRERGNG